jgi:hypothetical protein
MPQVIARICGSERARSFVCAARRIRRGEEHKLVQRARGDQRRRQAEHIASDSRKVIIDKAQVERDPHTK